MKAALCMMKVPLVVLAAMAFSQEPKAMDVDLNPNMAGRWQLTITFYDREVKPIDKVLVLGIPTSRHCETLGSEVIAKNPTTPLTVKCEPGPLLIEV